MEKDLLLIKTLFKKSLNLYQDKRFQDSINLLSNTSDLWINYIEKWRFLTLLGVNYFKLSNFNRAERIFLESLTIVPDNLKALDLLGRIYFIQGRYIESERIFYTAKKYDFYNFYLNIRMALSAWKSGNLQRMFKRLKDGYIPHIIGKKEEKKLKEFLLDFLKNSNNSEAYVLIKNFRKWCYEVKQKVKKKHKNQSIKFQ